jgi:hypothetical protein
MAPNPWRARRERREREEQEVAAFRSVRQAAREEVRDLARHTDEAPHSLVAARSALEAATTAEAVVAVEPLVRAARAALGLTEPEGRRSYQDVVSMARTTVSDQSPEQRVTRLRDQQRIDQGRNEYLGGGP